MTWFNTRTNRRLYITLYAFSLVLLYPFLFEYVGVIATLVFLLLSPLYYSRSTLVAAYRKDQMDERERMAVLESLRLSYGIFTATLLVSLAVSAYPTPSWLAGAARHFLFTPEVLLNFWTLLLLALVLPVCVIVWLEPDPLPEEIEARSQAGKKSTYEA
jgi:hypothetical protein